MTQRQFRPGFRGPGGRKMGNDPSRITDERILWLDYGAHKILLMKYPNGSPEGDEGGVGEVGPNYVIIWKQAGRRPLSVNLGSLTENEVKLMREFFIISLNLAQPVAAERDEVARRAADEGDDSYSRIYRPVPNLVARQGPVGEDAASIHERLANLPCGQPGDVGGDSGGVRGAGPVLAPVVPKDPGSEDNPSSSD